MTGESGGTPGAARGDSGSEPHAAALAELDARQMESLCCRCCGAAGMDAVF
ncbi:hypothetical protein RAH42_12870 [Pyramidobacter sp. YE332]|uniref:hypothetical protein n=1 Tax=Pyramidobacter sp. YE332 TaxID=3068894 RepID=UPI00294B5713|nr:hypothetical protein [Pyramidobacter sp. YE332]WOL40010.1 hypothetical protein RAH42_12870 [Pyramidobacter sp. YE332]